MNEFSCAGSLSVQAACRARKRNVANAARRPTSRCSGTGTFSRGRCAPANDRYGAVDRYTCPPGASTRAHSRRYSGASATCSITACDSTRSKVPVAERQRHAVGQREVQVARCRARGRAARRRPGTGRAGSMPTTDAASSASDSGIPPPPQPASSTRPRIVHAGALEERDHLRAAVVLEQRVVVLGAEPQVGVRLDGALVNPAHARSRPCTSGRCRRSELVDERRPVVAGRRSPRRRTS